MTQLVIKRHRIDGVPYQPSKNISGKFQPGQPKYIVIHFTGGSSAQSSIDFMATHKSSAHTIVDRDGTITQLVPFDTIAWHAGKSSWKGLVGMNNYSIGIEIANYGALRKTAAGYMAYNHLIDNAEVVLARHKNGNPDRSEGEIGWESYYTKQIESVSAIISALKKAYPSIVDVIGHDDIAPVRKTDPGPAAPMGIWKNALKTDLDRGSNDEDFWEIESKVGPVNFRTAPEIHPSNLIGTLPDGTKVKVLKRQGDWYNVVFNTKMGWVHSSYLVDI